MHVLQQEYTVYIFSIKPKYSVEIFTTTYQTPHVLIQIEPSIY